MEVYRILDRKTEEVQGSYSRAYHDEYDFNSAESARRANVHGMFEDKEKYKINKYRVIYELIEEDV
jgi:mRNA-degrading endonuclease RelE of RelBE toxin-antitoxin system